MIRLAPFDALAAYAVLRDLDGDDLLEVAMMRGQQVQPLDLFTEWNMAQGQAALSMILKSHAGTPFAVLVVLAAPGAAGMAHAALLSRPHRRWWRGLAQAAVLIRRDMPGWADQVGLRRIEARSWAGHPRAGRFLSACGFSIEATMGGFGPDGGAVFHQFAWTRGEQDHVQHTEI